MLGLVVAKLLNIVQPDIAVFGQKDAQQAFLVRRMVGELNFPVEIEVARTVREEDGLAMSSRNRFLQPNERLLALRLSEALNCARQAADAGQSVEQILLASNNCLNDADITAEYVDLVDPHTFQPIAECGFRGKGLLIIAAVIGTTRLIDNAEINIAHCLQRPY